MDERDDEVGDVPPPDDAGPETASDDLTTAGGDQAWIPRPAADGDDLQAIAPLGYSGEWQGDDWSSASRHATTWSAELPRWLATLDGSRTRREYEKAVTYFFHTLGVPNELDNLTFDLLLAYRGSLALRADRQLADARGGVVNARAARSKAPAKPLRAADAPQHLPSGADASADTDAHAQPDANDPESGGGGTSLGSALSPATVNIRLTALRQFLVHCSLWGRIPHLDPERIRAALRRLRIERRRPYQILAEPEWAAFLRTARAPATEVRGENLAGVTQADTSSPPGGWAPDRPLPTRRASSDAHEHVARSDGGTPATARVGQAPGGLWGVTRAARNHDQARGRATLPAANRLAADVRVAGASPRQSTGDRADSRPSTVSTTRSRTSPDTSRGRRHDDGRIRSRAGLTGERTALRDHALLALALTTGLRAVELCGLDVGDLTREWHAGAEEWWLALPDAKTKGQHGGRTLPLTPVLITTLMEYLRASGRRWEDENDRRTPLFLSNRRLDAGDPDQHDAGPDERSGQPRARLSTGQVRRIVDRVETQWRATSGEGIAEGRSISPHALRHSTAVALLEGNDRAARPPASVEHVRGWLGHFDIRTTQGYLAHLDARRHRRPFAIRLEAGTEDRTGDRENTD